MVIKGEDVAIVVGVGAFLLGGAGILMKLGSLAQMVSDLSTNQKESQEKLEWAVTLPMCEKKQTTCTKSVCDKVEEIKKSVAQNNEHAMEMVGELHHKIDANDKAMAHELSEIKRFMGRIEGLIEAGALTVSIPSKESTAEETRG